LYNEVKKVLEDNKSQRHLRGGMATKKKYEELSRARQTHTGQNPTVHK